MRSAPADSIVTPDQTTISQTSQKISKRSLQTTSEDTCSITSRKASEVRRIVHSSYRASGGEETNYTSQRANCSMDVNESSPLLSETYVQDYKDTKGGSGWSRVPGQVSAALISSLRSAVATFTLPLHYIVACFFDEQGNFSPLLPLYSIYRKVAPRRRKRNGEMTASEKTAPVSSARTGLSSSGRRTSRPSSIASASSTFATDSEMDEKPVIPSIEDKEVAPKSGRNRSSMSSGDEISPARRSIRIKLHNDELFKRKRLQDIEVSGDPKDGDKDALATALKSPSSPGISKLTKFPRAPAPPRPLIPRRQPSYAVAASQHNPNRKTLVIDLDETLIHSHSKGGRFATGHMVEVKIQQFVGTAGNVLGPPIPILYYVHKRPYCDEFLRKVSKWYNLVIFTASVQEYADPVIDWLELERSYFSGRYYRQHCTNRSGAYIKDLSTVEPDLSKVMILDNSPVSYVFHEDNAIPIEGWISDPTDNDLLNLIPILEGLSHVTDVRALLALRLGQQQVDAS